MAAYGLYTHIASNRFRSMVLLAGLFVLVYVMVYAGALIAEVLRDGGETVQDYLMAGLRDLILALPYATGGAVLWIVIAYFFHQSIVDAVTGGEDVTRQQQPRLYNLVENLCISRGIPMPKLKIIESDALNAYATGLNQRQYAVTVTSGLLNALNDQEVESVLGHELTHIRNGDVQMMVIAVIIAGVVGVFRRAVLPQFHQFRLRLRLWRRLPQLVVVFIVVVLIVFFGQRPQRLRRGRDRRDHRRGGVDWPRLAAVATGAAGAVAIAGAAGGCRIGRTDQKPRRHDLGAAQDRAPRRVARRHLGGDGTLPRQSARRLFRPVCHPPLGGIPGRGAGEIRRRARSRTAGAAIGARTRRSAAGRRRPGSGADTSRPMERPAVQSRRPASRCVTGCVAGCVTGSLGPSGRAMGQVELTLDPSGSRRPVYVLTTSAGLAQVFL